MPFTFAHPAAVVPIHRAMRGLMPLSPLVVGSMIPDVSYALPHDPLYRNSFLIGFPAGIAALWLFHHVVKRPAIRLMPLPMRVRLAPYAGSFSMFSPRRLLWISLGLAIGIFTHAAWDSM